MVARTGEITDPLLANVFIAKRLNRILGGPFFAPWDVEHIPDDTLETILSIEDLGAMQTGLQQVDSIFARWRADHARK